MLDLFSGLEILLIGMCSALIAHKWISSLLFKRKHPFFLSAVPLQSLFILVILHDLISPWWLLFSMSLYPFFGLMDADKDHNKTSRFFLSYKISWLALLSLLGLLTILILGYYKLAVVMSCLIYVFYACNLVYYLHIRIKSCDRKEKLFWLGISLILVTAYVILIWSLINQFTPDNLTVCCLFILAISSLLVVYFYLESYRAFIEELDLKRSMDYKANLSLINSNKILKARLLSYENKAFNNQMNPHFLYNAINSINALILAKNEKMAAMYIDELSELLKRTLERTNSSFNSLQDELSIVNSYVELENLRLNSAVLLKCNVQESLDTERTYLPHLFFQSVIENSIWHGLSESTEGRITLDIFTQNDLLTIKITDNGIGIKASIEKTSKEQKNGDQHKSAGLDIIKHRLDILKSYYGVETSLEINDLSEVNHASQRGTEVIITVPLIVNKPRLELIN